MDSPMMYRKNKEVVGSNDIYVSVTNVGDSKTSKDTERRHLRYKIIRTAALVALFLTIGLYNGVIGPTLQPLRQTIGATHIEIAMVPAGRALGFMLGAALGGVLFHFFYRFTEHMLFLSLLISAVCVFLLPWHSTITFVITMYCIVGICEGVKNTVGAAFIIQLWQEKAASPLNFFQGGFGVGAVLAPQLANVFIQQPLSGDNIMNKTEDYNRSDINIIHHHGNMTDMTSLDTQLKMVFGVFGLIITLIALLQLVFVFKGPPEDLELPKPQGSLLQMVSPASCSQGNMAYGVVMMMFLFLFFCSIGGGTRIYAEILFTALTMSGHYLTLERATLLQSVFWGLYATGRLVGGVLAQFISVTAIIIGDSILVIISALILGLFSHQSEIILWTFNLILAFTLSMLFPNGIAWANLQLNINSMATAYFIISYSVGAITYQSVIGVIFEYYGLEYLVWVIFTAICIAFILFFVLLSIPLLAKRISGFQIVSQRVEIDIDVK